MTTRPIPFVLLALFVSSVAHAQACSVDRIAAPAGSIENELGWVVATDGTTVLVTAPEELAFDPVTGANWGDDGGFHVAQLLPSGAFTVPQRFQWSSASALGLGRTGDLDGDFVVLGDAAFTGGADLYAFTNGPTGFVAEGRVAVPKPAGLSVQGLDFEIEAGRLVVLVRQDVGPTQATWLHTYARVAGAWSLIHSFALGAIGVGTGERRLALENDNAYVAFDTGQLAKFAWNGTAWANGGTASVAQAGPPFGETLDVDGGRIVGVGRSPLGLTLYSFLDAGGTPVAEPFVQLPPTAIEPTSIALEGDRLAIGSPSANGNRGQVELMQRVGGSWQYVETLTAAVDEVGERFGQSVAFDASGRLLVGAPHNGVLGFTDRGFVEVVELTGAGCASLLVHPASVSLSGLGTPVDLALVGPQSVAGFGYMVLVAASAATPGIPLDGVVIPLAFDALLLASIQYANQAPLSSTVGFLDAAAGSGAPRIQAQQLSPNLAGTSVAVAWFAFNLSTPPFGAFYASEARTLTLLP